MYIALAIPIGPILHQYSYWRLQKHSLSTHKHAPAHTHGRVCTHTQTQRIAKDASPTILLNYVAANHKIGN